MLQMKTVIDENQSKRKGNAENNLILLVIS